MKTGKKSLRRNIAELCRRAGLVATRMGLVVGDTEDQDIPLGWLLLKAARELEKK